MRLVLSTGNNPGFSKLNPYNGQTMHLDDARMQSMSTKRGCARVFVVTLAVGRRLERVNDESNHPGENEYENHRVQEDTRSGGFRRRRRAAGGFRPISGAPAALRGISRPALGTAVSAAAASAPAEVFPRALPAPASAEVFSSAAAPASATGLVPSAAALFPVTRHPARKKSPPRPRTGPAARDLRQ